MMTYEIANMLKEELESFHNKEGELYFYGAGDICEKMLRYFDANNFSRPVGIFDNTKKKQGSQLQGIPILSFSERSDSYQNMKVLITSTKFGNLIYMEIFDKLMADQMFNIQPYFEYNDLVYMTYRTKYRVESVKIPQVSQIPTEFQSILNKMTEYKAQAKRGENPEIVSDDIFYKYNKDVDFFKEMKDQTCPEKFDNSIKLQNLCHLDSLNKVVKISINDTDYLVGSSLELKETVEHSEIIDNISAFSEYLEARNIPFIYHQIPNKLSSLQAQLPNNLVAGADLSLDSLLKELRHGGVNTLDFREYMKKNKMNSLESFYKSDSHWKQSLSLVSAQLLKKEIENVLKAKLNEHVLEERNYKKLIFPNMFQGAYSRNTGLIYGGIDDFELYLPNYETDYTWSLPKRGFSIRGEAERVLTFTPALKWNLASETSTTYFSYGGIQVNDYTVVRNHRAENSLRVLFVCDSFTMPMSTFIAPLFYETHFFDIRTFQSTLTKKDLFELIDKFDFDVVIMQYWANAVLNQKVATDIKPL